MACMAHAWTIGAVFMLLNSFGAHSSARLDGYKCATFAIFGNVIICCSMIKPICEKGDEMSCESLVAVKA